MKNWPIDLPRCFLRETMSDNGFGEGRLQSTQESGAIKSRRRFSYVPIPFQGTMLMTLAQRQSLQAFWEFVGNGVVPFTFPAQFEPGDWIVKFGRTPPSWSPEAGGKWSVKLELFRLPQ